MAAAATDMPMDSQKVTFCLNSSEKIGKNASEGMTIQNIPIDNLATGSF